MLFYYINVNKQQGIDNRLRNMERWGLRMFFQGRLIISYIQEPELNRFKFQLAGGEELTISKEEFIAHWQAYRRYESERAAQYPDHYHPLPVTLETRRSIKVFPANVNLRRKRQSAWEWSKILHAILKALT